MSKTMTQDAIAHDPSKLAAFVLTFANFKTYHWTADEGWTCDQGGDAITSMNDMIVKARELLGLTPIPAYEIGEQEDWSCENCGETLQDGSGTCISCGQEDDEPSPCRQHKDTGRGVCCYCGVAI